MIISRCLTLIDGCKTCGATGQVNVGTWKKWDPRRQGHIMWGPMQCIWRFSRVGAPPKPFLDWFWISDIFSWNKPSSYWGVVMTMEKKPYMKPSRLDGCPWPPDERRARSEVDPTSVVAADLLNFHQETVGNAPDLVGLYWYCNDIVIVIYQYHSIPMIMTNKTIPI